MSQLYRGRVNANFCVYTPKKSRCTQNDRSDAYGVRKNRDWTRLKQHTSKWSLMVQVSWEESAHNVWRTFDSAQIFYEPDCQRYFWSASFVSLLFSLVRISESLYAKLSSTCIRCTHLLKIQRDPWVMPFAPKSDQFQIYPAASPETCVTSHSMENLAFHILLRSKIIILPILPTSPIYFLFKRLGECTGLCVLLVDFSVKAGRTILPLFVLLNFVFAASSSQARDWEEQSKSCKFNNSFFCKFTVSRPTKEILRSSSSPDLSLPGDTHI